MVRKASHCLILNSMYIKVKVITGAKKEEVCRADDITFKIAVRERAERNMANKRIIEILADQYDISLNRVRLVSGHHSPSKIFNILENG